MLALLALRLTAAFRCLGPCRGTIRRDVAPSRGLAAGTVVAAATAAAAAATEVAVVYEAALTAEPEGMELRIW